MQATNPFNTSNAIIKDFENTTFIDAFKDTLGDMAREVADERVNKDPNEKVPEHALDFGQLRNCIVSQMIASNLVGSLPSAFVSTGLSYQSYQFRKITMARSGQ